MKKGKNKLNSIIKAISYFIAVVIVIYTLKYGADSNYQNLFGKIGKIGSIIALILVVIGVIWAIYRIVKYMKGREK